VSGRAAPFYCPYCADEDLRPFDPQDGSAGHGQWRCNSCQRVFALKYIGHTGGWGSSDAEPSEVAQAASPQSDITRSVTAGRGAIA
jgi:transposase-like protein